MKLKVCPYHSCPSYPTISRKIFNVVTKGTWIFQLSKRIPSKPRGVARKEMLLEFVFISSNFSIFRNTGSPPQLGIHRQINLSHRDLCPSRVRAIVKYCSISQRKFSNSFALRAPTKGLCSWTLTFLTECPLDSPKEPEDCRSWLVSNCFMRVISQPISFTRSVRRKESSNISLFLLSNLLWTSSNRTQLD